MPRGRREERVTQESLVSLTEEIDRKIEMEKQRRAARRTRSIENRFAHIRRVAAMPGRGTSSAVVPPDPVSQGLQRVIASASDLAARISGSPASHRLRQRSPRINRNSLASLDGADLAGQKMYSLQANLGFRHIAEKRAECAICFEPLIEKPLGILTNACGSRACPHFLHAQCALRWVESGRQSGIGASCPICREIGHSVVMLPDFSRDEEAFFKALDVDSDGGLDRKEAMFTLQAILPVDRDGEWLSAHFDSLWERWDDDGDDRISFSEFTRPKSGFLAYVRAHCPSRKMTKPQTQIPSTADIRQWFSYWDENGNGVLDQNELVRAIIRTFNLVWSLQEVCAVQRFLKKQWKKQKGTGEIIITLQDLEVGFWQQLASAIETRRCELQNPDDINKESEDDQPTVSVKKGSHVTKQKDKRRKRSQSISKRTRKSKA